MGLPNLVKADGVEQYRSGEFAAVLRKEDDMSVFARVYGRTAHEAMANHTALYNCYLACQLRAAKADSWYAPYIRAYKMLMAELKNKKDK